MVISFPIIGLREREKHWRTISAGRADLFSLLLAVNAVIGDRVYKSIRSVI